MKKSRMILIAIISIALSTVFIFDQISAKDKSITIGFFVGSNWDVPNSESYTIIEDVIKRYEKKFPHVKVKYISGIQKDDYSEWLSKEVLKGEAPDVFFVLSDDFTSFSQVGLLQNLNTYIQQDKDFSKDAYYPSSYQAGVVDETTYALPYESVPNLVFVNKTLLEKEGIDLPTNNWTWDDFYNICKQVTKDTDGDGKVDQFGVYGYSWKEALFSNGASLFNDEGTKAFINSEKSIESFKFVRELSTLNENATVTAQSFDEGNVAFCLMQFSQYRAYMPYPWRVKKYSNFDWDCIMLPSGPNGSNISEVDTLLLGMNASSSNKEEAWELLKMLSHDVTTQLNIFKYSQGVSVLKEVTQSDEAMNILLKDTPGSSLFEMRILDEVMENGKSQDRFKKYNTLLSLIDNELYRIIYSESDLMTEIISLQRKVDANIK